MIDISKLSDQTIKKLKSAGWYENRRVDISELVTLYTKAGFSLPQKVFDFMSEFSGLEILGTHNVFDFNVESILGYLSKKNFDEMGDMLLFPVFPIGHVDRYHLLLDQNGRMFDYVQGLNFVGDDEAEGLENLCEGHLGMAVPSEYVNYYWLENFGWLPHRIQRDHETSSFFVSEPPLFREKNQILSRRFR